jgi:hypothetical protein
MPKNTDKTEKTEVEKTDEPKDKRTKATKDAGLYFNVNPVAKWLKNYYKQNFPPITVEAKKTGEDEKKEDDKEDDEDKDEGDKKGETSEHGIKIRKAQFALSAVDQIICVALVNLVSDKLQKTKSGLFEISEEKILDSIKIDPDFSYTFENSLKKYDSEQDYSKMVDLPADIVTTFIEKFGFTGGNTNVHLTKQAFNLTMYIMLQSRIILASTSYWLMTYAHKGNISDWTISNSIKIRFRGKLENALTIKVDEVSRIIRHDKDEACTDSAKEPEKDDEKPKKKKGSNDKKKDEDKDEDKKDGDEEDEEDAKNEEDEEDAKDEEVDEDTKDEDVDEDAKDEEEEEKPKKDKKKSKK